MGNVIIIHDFIEIVSKCKHQPVYIKFAGIPVIIVTRKDQQVDRVWGMRQGARDYITKPVKEGMLLDLISEALVA